MTIEYKIINTNVWPKVSIVSVEYGFSRTLVNGEWVNRTQQPERFETEILTFGKSFYNVEEAEKFVNSKKFKAIFKAVEKQFTK